MINKHFPDTTCEDCGEEMPTLICKATRQYQGHHWQTCSARNDRLEREAEIEADQEFDNRRQFLVDSGFDLQKATAIVRLIDGDIWG